MQLEREELIKQVFPGLRRMCRQRGVDLVEVDLRWGITEAQAERGEVLPLCIREIDQCRPYFIGILGAEYGSVPSGLPEAPWALPGASMTHMEIHWAALRPGSPSDRTYFFFKQNALGPEPQQALKTEIRGAGLPVEDYLDHEDLGRRVRRALETAIDVDFPKDEAPSWLELEQEAMNAFQDSRVRVYVPRASWYERLDTATTAVVTGPSGSGKSALLANWASRVDGKTFVHFFGATPQSTSPDRVVHRLLGELGVDVMSDSVDKRAAVAPALAAAAPITLILDAVENIEDLSWLPHPLPDGVRLIASGLPSSALSDLTRRGFTTLTLTALTRDERVAIVNQALAHHGKSLSEARLARIVDAPQTDSPLFLRTLTEELRLWGDHDALDQPIERMLGAKDVPELFALVLARLEADYEEDHPNLVRETLSAIAAARRGLTETELLAVVDATPLAWAPLHHAMEASLSNRGGVLTFFHDGLRRAVLQRYLPDDDALHARRRALIAYFEAAVVDERVAEELPWLQAEVADIAGLTRSLANLEIFLRLQVEAELQDLAGWWRKTGSDPAAHYRDSLATFAAKSPTAFEHALALHHVASFLRMIAKLEAALPMFEEARRQYERAVEPDDPNLGVIANDYGLALFIAGRFQEAEPLFREALEKTGEMGGILHNLAEILLRRNDLDEAESVAMRAVKSFQETFGRHEMTATGLQNLARARMEKGDLDGAQAALEEALEIVEGRPTRALTLALNNLGNLRLRQGRLQESEDALRRSIEMSHAVLGEDHPGAAATLAALAGTLFFAGKEDEAASAYRDAIALTERHLGPNHPNLHSSLVGLANLYLRRNEGEPAQVLAGRALAIAEREFGPNSIDAANAIQSLAACAAVRQNFDEASRLSLKAAGLHDNVLGPDHASTLRSWGLVAHFGQQFLQSDDAARAEPLLRKVVERNENRLGADNPQLGPDLWNLAQALVELGRPKEAVPYLERELALLELSKGPDDEETVASRKNLAAVRDAAAQSEPATP